MKKIILVLIVVIIAFGVGCTSREESVAKDERVRVDTRRQIAGERTQFAESQQIEMMTERNDINWRKELARAKSDPSEPGLVYEMCQPGKSYDAGNPEACRLLRDHVAQAVQR